MKKIFFGLTTLILFVMFSTSCNNGDGEKKEAENNESAAQEATTNASAEDTTGWITLFDGKDFTGWRGYDRTDIPKAWVIEDGAIKIQGSGKVKPVQKMEVI